MTAGKCETDDALTTYEYTAWTAQAGDPPAGLVTAAVEAVTASTSRRTEWTYTVHGLVDTVTYAVGTLDQATVDFNYDTADRLVTQIDELGHATNYV